MRARPLPVPLETASFQLPLFASPIHAGWPSPAEDYLEGDLDLNTLLIRNPPATYLLKVEGDSMIGAGIFDGDFVLVDRSLEPQPHHVVVMAVQGEFLIKRYERRDGVIILSPENPAYQPLIVTSEMEVQCFGVVRWVLHRLKRRPR